MTKEEILAKATAILSEEEYVNTCIKAGICPKCGTPLFHDSWGVIAYYCNGCSFRKEKV